MEPEADLFTRIKAKIQEIQLVIAAAPPQGRPLSIMTGPCGSILYNFYMAKMQNSGALYDCAFDLLEQTLEGIERNGVDYVTYCDGAVGFGVLFKLLATEGFIEAEVDDVMLALDDLVIDYTTAQLQADNLDFLHGAIGDGFYLLSRLGTPATDQCLARLITYLTTTATRDEQGIRWYDEPSAFNAYTPGGVNLSLSHGLSSKLIFLAHCVSANVKTTECTTLLLGAVQYLKNQACFESQANVYPTFTAASGHPRLSNRLAWCYGDLGIVVALLMAGKALGQAKWVEEAFALGLRAAGRITLEQTGVVDAGFCHGTAGIAHIFNRLYLESQQDAFRLARNYWLDRTLEQACFSDGLAGYKTYQQAEWVLDRSLLEGIMGINLVLQSSLEKEATNLSWDALFLLNFNA
ncbi:MAG: lanthionine synthetase C family protein [Janthinobacterium lividum]